MNTETEVREKIITVIQADIDSYLRKTLEQDRSPYVSAWLADHDDGKVENPAYLIGEQESRVIRRALELESGHEINEDWIRILREVEQNVWIAKRQEIRAEQRVGHDTHRVGEIRATSRAIPGELSTYQLENGESLKTAKVTSRSTSDELRMYKLKTSKPVKDSIKGFLRDAAKVHSKQELLQIENRNKELELKIGAVKGIFDIPLDAKMAVPRKNNVELSQKQREREVARIWEGAAYEEGYSNRPLAPGAGITAHAGEISHKLTSKLKEKLRDLTDAVKTQKYYDAIDRQRFLLAEYEALHILSQDRSSGVVTSVDSIDAELSSRRAPK